MMNRNVSWLPVAAAICLCFATSASAKNPKILFLGDSITMHYSPTVIELMDGKADVFRCSQNSSWTGRLLKHHITLTPIDAP